MASHSPRPAERATLGSEGRWSPPVLPPTAPQQLELRRGFRFGSPYPCSLETGLSWSLSSPFRWVLYLSAPDTHPLYETWV